MQALHDVDQELSAEVLDCPGQGDSRNHISPPTSHVTTQNSQSELNDLLIRSCWEGKGLKLLALASILGALVGIFSA